MNVWKLKKSFIGNYDTYRKGWTVKELFDGMELHDYTMEEKTLDDIREDIAENKAVYFPVTVTMYAQDISNYNKLGFTCYLVKAADFKTIKADYVTVEVEEGENLEEPSLF